MDGGLWLLVVLWGVTGLALYHCAENCQDDAGFRFMLFPFPLSTTSQVFHIHLTSAYPMNKTIDVHFENPLKKTVVADFPLEPDKRIQAKVSNYVFVPHNEILDSIFMAEATEKLIVYSTTGKSGSLGTALVMPNDVLGLHYIVAAYPPTPSTSDYAFIVIIASNPGTTTATIFVRGETGVTFTYNGNSYAHSDQFNVTFNQYESIILTTSKDLTGSEVTSDQPIAVYSGNLFLSLNRDSENDVSFEHMPRFEDLGTSFVVVASPFVTGTFVKIVAAYDSTTVNIDGTEILLTNKGDFHSMHFDSDIYATYQTLNSTLPILVVAFSTSSATYDGIRTDVAMRVVRPVEQFSRQYVFINGAASKYLTSQYIQYVSVFVPEGFTNDLVLDNYTGSDAMFTWTPMPNVDKGVNFVKSFTETPTEGLHRLYTTAKGKPFGGFMYGTSDAETYAAPLAKINRATWNNYDPIVRSNYSHYTSGQLPDSSPLRLMTSSRRLLCFSQCTSEAECGLLAIGYDGNQWECRFYQSHLRCESFVSVMGYELYLRDQDYN